MQSIKILLLLIFNLTFLTGFTQEDSIRTDIRITARKLFTQKDYVNALPVYRELLNSYPKEPEYLYSTAVCLINLNGDMDEAIRLLKPVSVTDYSSLAIYYLGRALHLNYSFEDAIKAYSKYLLISKGSKFRPENVERLIEMARNGIEYTRTGNRVRVQKTEIIQADQLQYATAISGSGKLMKKPVEFCSKADIRMGFRPWMFLPSYTEVNEYVYTAGYEATRKNGKQLYRIRNINHESWGIPEILGEVINTPYDEEFPFFDRKTSTLYFSSNGHSSMGGYDIFSSVYDWNTKKWSQPRNLGFPINSPYDDYIYVTDGFGSTVSFVSTRATDPGHVTVYRLRLEKDSAGIQFYSSDEIKKASLLEIIEAKPVQITEVQVQPVTENNTSTADTVIKPNKSSYNKILAEALNLQLRADSAARITRDLRIMAREIPDDSLRKQTVDEILRNDKLAKSLQRQADSKFADARKLRADVTPAVDSAVVLSREVNDIKVYQYRSRSGNADTLIKAGRSADAEITSIASENDEKPMSQVKSDQFIINDKPAYSDNNPIPHGLIQDTGLIYRVQLGVFSKLKPNDSFGGISPVAYEQVSGSTMLKYYAGLFYSMNSVTKALESIRSLGFPDAFIVAFLNGKPISTEKAKEIEFAGFKL